jgi:hypothetical protein
MTETDVQCPHCGEVISVLIDTTEDSQSYIEDCSVCCRPIQFFIRCDEGSLIALRAERAA